MSGLTDIEHSAEKAAASAAQKVERAAVSSREAKSLYAEGKSQVAEVKTAIDEKASDKALTEAKASIDRTMWPLWLASALGAVVVWRVLVSEND